MPGDGSLVVVGLGIKAGLQTTIEARACLRRADRLLCLGGDGLADEWLRRLNPRAEMLGRFLAGAASRATAYDRIAAYIVDCVRAGGSVCVAAYGHPGVFAAPLHAAVKATTEAGFSARMLPAVSAEACLYADLGLDPGACGAQSFDATDFLIRDRRFDPTSLLLLWQVGVIGVSGQRAGRDCWNRAALDVLAEVLAAHYGANHAVVLYEAARFPLCDPTVTRATLETLSAAHVTTATTAVVPPLPQRTPNRAMFARLCPQ